MKDPFIFKVLDISTGHMTTEDNEALEEEVRNGQAPVYELEDCGWFVYTGEIQDNWPSDKFSETFLNVLKKAKELGCDYVRWDRDGREYEELQTFDW